MSNNEIQPLGTRQLAFTFTRKNTTTVVDPTANTTTTSSGETTFSVSNVTIIAILGTFAAYTGILEHLGSFLASLVLSPEETSDALATRTQFVVTLSNFGCKTIDVTKEIKMLQGMDWRDSTSELTPTIVLRDNMCPSKLLTFLEFRNKLKSWDYLKQQTLLMLDRQYGTPDGPMAQLLNQLLAVPTGDNTGSGSGDQSAAWAKGLFNRITTGGPNGSMAGKIAVNFMSTVPVAASFDFTRKSKRNAFDDTTNPLVQILKDAVTSAAESAAQGLADYLKTLRKPSTTSDETDDDRQTSA